MYQADENSQFVNCGEEMKYAECHPDRRHYAYTLCRPCYKNIHEPTIKIAKCHPERKHKAKGLCEACYYKKRNLARVKKNRIIRERTKQKYQENPLPDKVQKVMDNWVAKLEDPALVENLVRGIFNTRKPRTGVYSA
jgi:hypothetical protein